ncbi:transposase [Streptomyces sp. Ac-502]|uniref:transposase n=1 Tax=Streptomyces sp. Ac-502 TaxID=3342801 RepID=UPI003862CE30
MAHGRLETETLRGLLASLPMPRFGARIVLAVDASPWLRSDAACSPDRLFCLVHGRNGRSSHHVVPDRPYSSVVTLTADRTSGPQVRTRFGRGPPTTRRPSPPASRRRWSGGWPRPVSGCAATGTSWSCWTRAMT